MTSAAVVVVAPEAPASRHTAGQSVLLHLGPALPALALYALAAPLARHLGLPSLAALALSGLLGVAPVQLALLARERRRHPGRPVVLLRQKVAPGVLLALVLAEVGLAAAAFAVTAPMAASLRSIAFAWWPTAWLLVTAGLVLLGSVVVAPVVEEHYFRGYLLPRMPARLGRGTSVAHAALFAGYHLWTPWLLPTRILALLPLVHVARRTQDLRVGVVTHVVLNAVDLVVLTRFVLST
jgi:membrane protease YdiL (CAAX protease family)